MVGDKVSEPIASMLEGGKVLKRKQYEVFPALLEGEVKHGHISKADA